MNAGVEARRRPRKRGDGEGTVYKRADGLWVGELMVGRKADGRRDVRRVSAKTRKECRTKLDDVRQHVREGTLVERHRLTVGDVLAQWLDDCLARGVRPKTLESYRQVVRLYLKPALGAQQLAALRPEQVRRMLTDLAQRPLSPATVRYCRTLLHGALDLAVRMEYVARNVVDATRPPKVQRPQIAALAPDDLAALLDEATLSGGRLAAYWPVAAYSGCRPGELLALRWADVDLGRGTLAIRHSLTRLRGEGPSLAEPKTARGRRTVGLAPEAVDALRAHRERQLAEREQVGAAYLDQDAVFCTHTGGWLDARHVVHAFKRLLASANARRPQGARIPPTLRLYDLRHAHATALLAAGVHPKVASERLGHASVTLTLDTYTHSVLRLDMDAGLLMQRLLRGDGPAPGAAKGASAGAVPAPIPAPGPGEAASRAGDHKM